MIIYNWLWSYCAFFLIFVLLGAPHCVLLTLNFIYLSTFQYYFSAHLFILNMMTSLTILLFLQVINFNCVLFLRETVLDRDFSSRSCNLFSSIISYSFISDSRITLKYFSLFMSDQQFAFNTLKVQIFSTSFSHPSRNLM